MLSRLILKSFLSLASQNRRFWSLITLEMKKQTCKLKNRDLTVWDAMQEVMVMLKKAGLKDEAERFWKETCKCKTHDEIVAVVSKYVKIE